MDRTTPVSLFCSVGRLSKRLRLASTEQMLARSCKTVIQLNDKIRGLTKRYDVTKVDGNQGFINNYRVRIAVTEGVRNMYQEYARNCAEEVTELRRDLCEESDDDNDDDSLEGGEFDLPSDMSELFDDDDESSLEGSEFDLSSDLSGPLDFNVDNSFEGGEFDLPSDLDELFNFNGVYSLVDGEFDLSSGISQSVDDSEDDDDHLNDFDEDSSEMSD